MTKFVEAYLAGFQCKQCKRSLELRDLVTVGVHRPPEGLRYDQRPLAVVEAQCIQCHSTYQLSGYQTKEEIIEDVVTIFDMVMFERDANEHPSPFKQMIDAAKTRAPSPATASPSPVEGGNVRPSRRKGAPDKPPTKAEIEQFIRRLKHASFRRSNGGFDRWLKRLEGDVDPSGSEHGDVEGKPPF